MSKVEVLNEEELTTVVGGTHSKGFHPSKGMKCLSGLTTFIVSLPRSDISLYIKNTKLAVFRLIRYFSILLNI